MSVFETTDKVHSESVAKFVTQPREGKYTEGEDEILDAVLKDFDVSYKAEEG